MFTTVLGCMVPDNDTQMIMEDAILDLLYKYRINPQNPNNMSMKLSEIVHAVSSDNTSVIVILDGLLKDSFQLVEECEQSQGERTFRLTKNGIRFIGWLINLAR